MDTTLYIEDSDIQTLDDIPDYVQDITIINAPYLTSLPKLPKDLFYLKIDNVPITQLPELPKSTEYLYINNVPITELPELPKSLRLLNINRTKITELPKLHKKLLNLEASNNQITEFPKITKDLQVMYIHNNNIETFPSSFKKFKNLKNLRIENNPGSLQYYKVNNVNENNISFENEIPVLTLKKGMVLFHNMYEMKNIYDMYLGIKVGDSYVMNPNSQIYFLPHPFHTVAYGTITTICVLQNDVKVILGIKPSNLIKKDITSNNKYFTRENCKDEVSLLKSRFVCSGEDVIKNNIMGWITHDIDPLVPGGATWHAEDNNFMQYYKYVSYYENKDNTLDRPEIMMHPYKRRLTEDVITPETEVFEASLLSDKTWLDKNEHKFNYKIIEIIDDNQKFKEYKDIIDSFLSKKGHNGYHMFRNEKDGFYMIREFM